VKYEKVTIKWKTANTFLVSGKGIIRITEQEDVIGKAHTLAVFEVYFDKGSIGFKNVNCSEATFKRYESLIMLMVRSFRAGLAIEKHQIQWTRVDGEQIIMMDSQDITKKMYKATFKESIKLDLENIKYKDLGA
jgi:hypothetical protein